MDELRQASADLQQTQNLTPPPELVRGWILEAHDQPPGFDARVIANLAAQWGADQELEACYRELDESGRRSAADHLRFARRPKRPSLAEEALALINHDPVNQPFLSNKGKDTIRRALKRLQQLEEQQ
jgi:hypothetical protein